MVHIYRSCSQDTNGQRGVEKSWWKIMMNLLEKCQILLSFPCEATSVNANCEQDSWDQHLQINRFLHLGHLFEQLSVQSLFCQSDPARVGKFSTLTTGLVNRWRSARLSLKHPQPHSRTLIGSRRVRSRKGVAVLILLYHLPRVPSGVWRHSSFAMEELGCRSETELQVMQKTIQTGSELEDKNRLLLPHEE